MAIRMEILRQFITNSVIQKALLHHLVAHQINLASSIATDPLQPVVFLLEAIHFTKYRRQVELLDSQLFLADQRKHTGNLT